MRRLPVLVPLVVLGACASEVADAPLDPENERFAGPKADGFCLEPGSPEATAVLAWVEEAGLAELDDPWDEVSGRGGAGLNRLAAEGIVERRPFDDDLDRLDEVPYVGNYACGQLRTHVCDRLGLCGDPTCDPDAFEAPPPRTRFTAGCLDTLLRLRELPAGERSRTMADVENRCTSSPPLERRALDWAVEGYGYTPSDLVEAGDEYGIAHETRRDGSLVVDIVDIDSWNDGVETLGVFVDGEPFLVRSDDGLGSDERWTCGADDEEAIEQPWGPCARAFLRPACGETEDTATTVPAGPLDDTLPFRVLHAVRHYAGESPAQPVEVAIYGCDERARLVLETDGRPTARYEVLDDAGGTFLLTVQEDVAPPRVLCDFDFPG